jgi:hypothetical protein
MASKLYAELAANGESVHGQNGQITDLAQHLLEQVSGGDGPGDQTWIDSWGQWTLKF